MTGATNNAISPLDYGRRDASSTSSKAAKAITTLKRAVFCLLLVCLISLGIIIAVLVLFGIHFKQNKLPEFVLQWPAPSASPLGRYVNGAVAADNGYCSEIGRDTLIRGGNVIHAAIATAFCTGVMDAHSSGIGGGHFMTIYNRTTGICTVIDSREAAPAAANQDMYVNHTADSKTGWRSIGIPGEVHGLWTAYQHAGNAVSWRSLLQPTIDLLTNGQPVSAALAKAIAANEAAIKNSSTFLGVFMHPDGTLYKRGDILKRPVLAQTLMGLANAADPVQYFYNSTFTSNLVRDIQTGGGYGEGGIITMQDMQRYESIVRDQSQVIYSQMSNGLTACGPPPPSSAAVAISILNVMAGYPVFNPQQNMSNLEASTDVFQRFVETMKFAYADRSQMGDLHYVQSALPLAKNITSSAYAKYVRDKITAYAHSQDYYGGQFSKYDSGTAHMSLIDKEGNAVSITSTINLYFGSKRRSPSTGIILNDEMDDFSTPGLLNFFGFPPSPNNFIKPGKRPQSSMSPIVLFDTNTKMAKMAVGAAGGSKIISSTAYVAMRTLQLKETVKQAVDAPRIHNQLRPFYTQYETPFPQVLVDSLSTRGQDMRASSASTVATAVYRASDGYLYASSDWRKGDESFCAGF